MDEKEKVQQRQRAAPPAISAMTPIAELRMNNRRAAKCGNAEMRKPPKKLETKVERLAEALEAARIAVFDFETSGVRPPEIAVAGLGVYLPVEKRCFYINVGRTQPDDRFPTATPE